MNELTIFDLDETLLHGDTSVIWRKFLQEKGIITDPDYDSKDQEMMRHYAQGTLNLEEYITFSLNPIAHIPTDQIDELIKECVTERAMRYIFPEAQETIKKLINQSPDDVLIISATVSIIVKHIATILGIKHAIGINLSIENNCYTPTITGTPSFREGKVVRLQQWLAEHNKAQHYDKITFYTDSINDLPLCEYADEVYTVNPCPQLRPIAQSRGWHILDWSI